MCLWYLHIIPQWAGSVPAWRLQVPRLFMWLHSRAGRLIKFWSRFWFYHQTIITIFLFLLLFTLNVYGTAGYISVHYFRFEHFLFYHFVYFFKAKFQSSQLRSVFWERINTSCFLTPKIIVRIIVISILTKIIVIMIFYIIEQPYWISWARFLHILGHECYHLLERGATQTCACRHFVQPCIVNVPEIIQYYY